MAAGAPFIYFCSDDASGTHIGNPHVDQYCIYCSVSILVAAKNIQRRTANVEYAYGHALS